MARFYSLVVERDLFGRTVLVRRWGRLGTAGRTRLDEHKGEGEALATLAAMQRTDNLPNHLRKLRLGLFPIFVITHRPPGFPDFPTTTGSHYYLRVFGNTPLVGTTGSHYH